MNKLKFYIIEEKYIKYLSEFDSHVSYNKNEKRPYIGIVLDINEHLYFAPMYFPKPQHNKYKNNPTFLKLKDKNNNNLGIIRFSEMIPIQKNSYYLLNINSRGKLYKKLLADQYHFINNNKNIIYNKAYKIYEFVTIKHQKFYIDLSCNFKLLEEKCLQYKKQ